MLDPSSQSPIAFQGAYGAYSDLASRAIFPDRVTLPCTAFEDALSAVTNGAAEFAVIPIENSLAGRVADVYHLLPNSGLYIIGEHFEPVHHHLLVLPSVELEDITQISSHVHALGQCRKLFRELGVKPLVAADTAGSAAALAKSGDRTMGVIASGLCTEIYGLVSLRANVEDEAHNTTRFVVLSREPKAPSAGTGLVVTTFIFRTRNVPAALYKAMGGFATNGINITKIESYMVDGEFAATEFYADVEADQSEQRMVLALEELGFFTKSVRILGSYPGHSFRQDNKTGKIND